MTSTIKCTAAGDAMIFRRLPGAYEGFPEVQNFIAQGDLRFVNLETTIHRFETYGAAESGGSWFCSSPDVLNDIKTFGFNTVSTANNHAMDYAHVGLLKTLEYVQQSGLLNCGVGRSMGEAAAPAYLDTLAGRIAVIGACSSFKPDAMAGEQTRTMPGRPGLNGIRVKTTYHETKEHIDALRAIAADTAINAASDISRREGYLSPIAEGHFKFGEMEFVEDEEPRRETHPMEADMKRMERSIQEALFMADYVVVAMHSHQLGGFSKEQPDQFYEEFARRCIDLGAHAVIGSGPHLLRPIEIYKGCPIFYSLGDFIIQLETVEKAPAGMFEKQKLTGNEGLDVMFNKRSDFGKKGLYYSRIMFESVIPYWEAENGKLTKLVLMPVELNFDKPRSTGGWPRPYANGGILERLAEMSAPYGTRIRIENGLGIVEL